MKLYEYISTHLLSYRVRSRAPVLVLRGSWLMST